jgi:hypothetical protein
LKRTHVIIPADVEPFVVATTNGKKPVDWNLIESVGKGNSNPRLEFLDSMGKDDRILAPLGGIGDAFLLGAMQRGITDIQRIPFIELNAWPADDTIEAPAKFTAAGAKQAERCESACKMLGMLQADKMGAFRQFTQNDAHISAVRVYLGQLLAIQDEIRKRLEQRTVRLERDQAYFLPGSNEKFVSGMRFDLINSQNSIDALKVLENDLTKEIERHLKKIPVYQEIFAPVRGMGPRLSARIICPIVDITRFPTRNGLVRYAGWHVMDVKDSSRTIAARFTRGESAQFHQLLRQGLWLFEDQILRNNSQFRFFYDGYLVRNAELIGQSLYPDSSGKGMTMTKGWLHKRALRFAASKFLRYAWQGWWQLEGVDKFGFPAQNWLEPEKYYRTDLTPIR